MSGNQVLHREQQLQIVPPKSPRWVPGSVVRYGTGPQGETIQHLQPVHATPAGAASAGEGPEGEAEAPGEVPEGQWYIAYVSSVDSLHLEEVRRREPYRFPDLLRTVLRSVGSAVRRAYESGDLNLQALFSPSGVWWNDTAGHGHEESDSPNRRNPGRSLAPADSRARRDRGERQHGDDRYLPGPRPPPRR